MEDRQHASFKDRTDAGQQLAKNLVHLTQRKTIVLAIPNGGIPIGVEVAKALNLPLELVLVHKLHLPDRPETRIWSDDY